MLNLGQGPRYDMQGLNRQLQDLLAQYSNLAQQQTAPAPAPQILPAQATAPAQQIIYVTGVDGARAVKLPPSSSVALMDSQSDTLFVKATDANGTETLFARSPLNFEDVGPEATDAVTRKDLEDLKADLRKIVADIKGGAEQ